MGKCWSFWCKRRSGCREYQAMHECRVSCLLYGCDSCRLFGNVLCERYRYPHADKEDAGCWSFRCEKRDSCGYYQNRDMCRKSCPLYGCEVCTFQVLGNECNGRQKENPPEKPSGTKQPKATDGTRTRGPDLGKVVLHQLSHCRIKPYYHSTTNIIFQNISFVNTFLHIFLIFYSDTQKRAITNTHRRFQKK